MLGKSLNRQTMGRILSPLLRFGGSPTMKRLLVAVIAAAAFCGATALAADMPTKAPIARAPASVFTWTGFYLGIAGGGGWGDTRHTNSFNGATSGTVDINGGLFGGTYGYNWQSGSWVFGLEGDISWSGIRATFNDTGTGFCAAPLACVTDLRWLGTGRARLGYAWGQSLVYGTGGVAYGNVRATVTNSACCNSETHTRVGYAVGGGFETAFSTNWSVKLEYLYVNFGTKANYTAVGIIAENVFLDSHIVRAGLNYRFNWGGPVVARY